VTGVQTCALPISYYFLGIALHYIQDAYTTYPSFLPKHEEWEEWIENSEIVSESNIEATIQQTVKNRSMRRICSSLVYQLSMDIEGREATLNIASLNGHKKDQQTIASPKVDLFLGYRGSYVVSKSVLGPKTHQTLELNLARNLIEHEKQLYNVEKDQSKKVIKLIRERDELQARITPSFGPMAKIRNWFNGIRLGWKAKSALYHFNLYSNEEHFSTVTKRYLAKAESIASGYSGWYNYQIPQLIPSIVTKELLDIKSASRMFGLKEEDLRIYLNENKKSQFSQ
jgi:hypothetical protein